MLKRVKNVLEKIKFIFKCPDNANISFKSNISMELNQVSKGNAIKQSRSDDNSTYSIHDDTNCFVRNDFKPFGYELKKCDKDLKVLVLRAAYGDDKLPLINILNRTKKFRIRKKLMKRISN